jgi:hypothetical protein
LRSARATARQYTELEHLAVASGQPIEGGTDGGILLGNLGDLARESNGRRSNRTGPPPAPTTAAMMIGDDASSNAEQPWVDALSGPAETADAGDGASHRLTHNVFSEVATNVVRRVRP